MLQQPNLETSVPNAVHLLQRMGLFGVHFAEIGFAGANLFVDGLTKTLSSVDTGAMKLAGRPTLTRALHQSGRKLYIEMTFALVRDAGGAVVGSVAMARDVTERVERERAAKAAQNS